MLSLQAHLKVIIIVFGDDVGYEVRAVENMLQCSLRSSARQIATRTESALAHYCRLTYYSLISKILSESLNRIFTVERLLQYNRNHVRKLFSWPSQRVRGRRSEELQELRNQWRGALQRRPDELAQQP